MQPLLFGALTSAGSLVVNPRFAGLPRVVQVALLGLFLAAPLVLMVWLYRTEMRLVRPAVARGLLALRLAVVALIWFVLMLQPAWSRTASETVTGQVLVAVDRSDSMRIADPQRTPAEKIALAAALGLDRGLVEGRLVAEWLRDSRGRGEYLPAIEAERGPFTELLERADALTRLETVRRLLDRDGVRLIQRLQDRHAVKLAAFTQDIADWPADKLAALTAADEGRESGAYTDLQLPLKRALEMSGPNQTRVVGIVVPTDGQHDWGPSPVAKAAELGQRGIPVYPVVIGGRTPPPDIAVTRIEAPSGVFKGDSPAVDVGIQVHNLPARKLRVTLNFPEVDGKPTQPPISETVAHDGGTPNYNVTFRPEMKQLGVQTMTVTVKPESEEKFTDNNSRKVRITVADDKAKVLLIDGEARWEFHYLATALARDPTMDLSTVVFQQPRIGRVPEADLRKAGNPSLTLPPEPDAYAAYNCIILGDITPDRLPPAERARLERYVADQEGTLVILAGKRSMPLSFVRGDVTGEPTDPIGRLLPIENAREVKPTDGFPMALTAEGKQARFLQMEPTADRSEQRWASLPRHFWGVVGKAKPGATVLAVGPDPAAQDGEPAPKGKATPDRERALVVRQNYGFGRVLFVGVDSTWRYRFKTGDLYHHRFWSQVIRWAAADKALPAGNASVRFGTREPAYTQKQEVELIARLTDQARPLAADALAGARIWRKLPDGKEESAAMVSLGRRPALPRELEGKVRDLAPGRYEIELVIPDLADQLTGSLGPDGQPLKLRAGFEVLPPDAEEMVNLATNWPLLEEIAAKSGGRVFTPEDVGELIDLLGAQASVRTYAVEHRLWQSWLTLIAFLVLLTVEWVVRKWAGLP